MKTHQKIQYQSRPRKSPRFSSAQPTPKSTPKTEPDDTWALSLHVAEQVPLKICYPSDEEDKPIRRSSRSTANKYKTQTQSPEINQTKPLYPFPQALTLRGEEEDEGDEQLEEDREVTGRAMKKAKLGLDESILLRRSYRLKGGKIGNSAPQLLALPGPSSKSMEKSFLSEKRLRSRSVLMHKVEKVSTKVNSSSIKCLLPPVNHSLVKSPEVTVKSASSKKCLKSSFVKLSDENVKSKGLIELYEIPRRNSLRSSLKGSGESSKQALPEKTVFSSEKHLKSSFVKLSDENVKSKDLIELTVNLRRNSLRRSLKDSGESSKQASSEKSVFSSEKHLKSRNVIVQSHEETLETLPESSGSSLRRSHKNNGESSIIEPKNSAYSRSAKMHYQKEISETLTEKSKSSLQRSRMNGGENSKIESKKSAFSGEKCLSSRSVEMELENESLEKNDYVLNEKRLLSPKIESVLEELFGISEETDVEKSDSDVASEKCEV